MSGVPKIAIAESVESLKELMKAQKPALNYAKVQAIYLLKIKAVETVRYLAVIVGEVAFGSCRKRGGDNSSFLVTAISRRRSRKIVRNATENWS